MSSITIEKLKELASRIKLDMSEEQYKTLQGEFDTILKQMDLLGEIENVDNVEPMTFPFEVTTFGMRPDEVVDQLPVDDVLKNAKQVQNNMIKIKKVVG